MMVIFWGLRSPAVETESRVCTVCPETFQPVTCPFRAPALQEELTCLILLCLPLTKAFCRLKLPTQSNAPPCKLFLCVINSAKDFCCCMFSVWFIWFSVSTVTQNYWMKFGERIGHRLRQKSWNFAAKPEKGADPMLWNIAAFFSNFINVSQNNVWTLVLKIHIEPQTFKYVFIGGESFFCKQ